MKTILVVDDDRDFAEGIAEVIELGGHRVLLAFNSEESLRVIMEQDIDMVFMDIRMPRTDGVDTILKLKKVRNDINIVMMTGYTDKALHQKALDNGASSVLSKPIDADELIAFINSNGVENVILLVDDDEDFSASLESLLSRYGYKVNIARGREEAIAYSLRGRIDLVLLDLRLPETDGLEVYSELRNRGMSPPAFVITAYPAAERRQIERLRSLSVGRVFQKPFNPDDLLEAIKNIHI